MFDLRDLYALPIAFSLTLWDAAPVYLSVGLALAILMRTLLTAQALHTTWRLRETMGIEGLLYLALFRPSLLPVLVFASIVASTILARQVSHISPPSTPGAALRIRFGELSLALLLPCIAAAVVKIFAPDIPENLMLQITLALAGSILIGGWSGTSAIPSVAIAVHAGGFIPAAVWILGAAGRKVVTDIRYRRSQRPVTPI
ncbi:MAG: hypothetical protein H0V47_05855 [Chloroflexia bacterium]|nr:hypothetical protein [Chloroflexia bacterium]